ncbi:hypothetical protein PC116_g7931 [Phytophthora cactorum]|nr:hypothetical protein C6341_g20532 [Phytophthora cactorum]KAG3164614.1 hypothetical protein PC128_g20097 [Phytophthora cactorum]KAG4244263.1 hypothetical protein PC116_g7931 [Phytophthora cactorum]
MFKSEPQGQLAKDLVGLAERWTRRVVSTGRDPVRLCVTCFGYVSRSQLRKLRWPKHIYFTKIVVATPTQSVQT